MPPDLGFLWSIWASVVHSSGIIGEVRLSGLKLDELLGIGPKEVSGAMWAGWLDLREPCFVKKKTRTRWVCGGVWQLLLDLRRGCPPDLGFLWSTWASATHRNGITGEVRLSGLRLEELRGYGVKKYQVRCGRAGWICVGFVL